MRRAAAVAVAALVAAATVAGCRAGATPPRRDQGCRALALAGERWLAAAPATERDQTLQLAVELIDACQATAMGPGQKICLGTAATPAAALTCPGVAVVHRGAVPRALPHARAPAAEPVDQDDLPF